MNLARITSLAGLLLILSPVSATFANPIKYNAESFTSYSVKEKDNRDNDRDKNNTSLISALRDLKQAKRDLERAPRRYSGKRAAALDKTNDAIRLIEQALREDRKR